MTAQAEAPLLVDIVDGIATLTLNRPRALNALSEAVMAALQEALERIGQDTAVKVVIIRGAGGRFCAGHDLKEMTARRADPDGGQAYFSSLFAACAQMMTRIVRLPQPVIAEVQGIATAAGCQLVASCDLAVAAETARFATSGVNIGLFCSTPMVALSRNISRKQAMEMLLLGAFIPAQRAYEMGLVNRVVAEDQLTEATQAMAQAIVAKSPKALKIGKAAFYAQAEMDLDAAYAYAAQAMAENMMAQDAKAGIGAFINKQPSPEWTGE